MKLDHNVNSDGQGKYALLNLRRLANQDSAEIRSAVETLDRAGIVQWGEVGAEDEFFVIKLKDVNATGGLNGYADQASKTDYEWANEVRSMLPRAGTNSPYCKMPD